MDARKMKKYILVAALDALAVNISNAEDKEFEYGFILDTEKVSIATIQRFDRVLEQMRDNAESKV